MKVIRKTRIAFADQERPVNMHSKYDMCEKWGKKSNLAGSLYLYRAI